MAATRYPKTVHGAPVPEAHSAPVPEAHSAPVPEAHKVVFITGAAGGVGSACVERFSNGGWRVAASDLTQPSSSSDSVAWFPADVRSASNCRAAVDAAAGWGGRLDAVVNAAGLWTEGPAEDTEEADWNRVIDVNLKGTYFIASAAIPHLRHTKGCIVNMSSDAGIQGNKGAAVYCASKGGVSILTKALALELAPHGVRCNAVCPSDIDTPMLQFQATTFGDGDPAGYVDNLLAAYPGGSAARLLKASEVAELIWFLCQPHAAGINGANLSIDQGLSAGIF